MCRVRAVCVEHVKTMKKCNPRINIKIERQKKEPTRREKKTAHNVIIVASDELLIFTKIKVSRYGQRQCVFVCLFVCDFRWISMHPLSSQTSFILFTSFRHECRFTKNSLLHKQTHCRSHNKHNKHTHTAGTQSQLLRWKQTDRKTTKKNFVREKKEAASEHTNGASV